MGYKLKTTGASIALALAFAIGGAVGADVERNHGPVVSHVMSNDVPSWPLRFDNLTGPQQAALIADRLRRAGLTPQARAWEDSAVAHCLAQHGAPMYGWIAEDRNQTEGCSK